MPNIHQIRYKLDDWMNGRVSLAEFEDWFVPATWNIHQSGDQEAASIVNEIELNLSEYSGGHLSQEELRIAMGLVLGRLSNVPDHLVPTGG